MQTCIVFQVFCPSDVLLHRFGKLPLLPDSGLFLSELLDVSLDIFIEEDFLQVEECLVFKGQFLILKDLVEVQG
jgi:hypothetical protein